MLCWKLFKQCKITTTPNLNFFILYLIRTSVGGECKQFIGHNTCYAVVNSIWNFVLLASRSALCKGSEFLQFCEKIQSSMCIKYSPRCISQFLSDLHRIINIQRNYSDGHCPIIYCTCVNLPIKISQTGHLNNPPPSHHPPKHMLYEPSCL